MYAMCGKLIAKPSQRGQLVEILLRAAQTVGQLSSCRLYAVNEDLADEVTVWVMEIWWLRAIASREEVLQLVSRATNTPGGVN